MSKNNMMIQYTHKIYSCGEQTMMSVSYPTVDGRYKIFGAWYDLYRKNPNPMVFGSIRQLSRANPQITDPILRIKKCSYYHPQVILNFQNGKMSWIVQIT